MIDDKYNTDLDLQLQALATSDWITFAKIILCYMQLIELMV